METEAIAASADAAPLPCASKARYSNRKRAAQAASRLRHRIAEHSGGIAEPLEVYKCASHHCWHIGHPIGWRKETNRPRTAVRISL